MIPKRSLSMFSGGTIHPRVAKSHLGGRFPSNGYALLNVIDEVAFLIFTSQKTCAGFSRRSQMR